MIYNSVSGNPKNKEKEKRYEKERKKMG